MKRFFIVFSIFCLFFTVSCSVVDEDEDEIDFGDTGTGRPGSEEDELPTHDTDTTDNNNSDTDNADTFDSGTDADSNDTETSDIDTPDNNDEDDTETSDIDAPDNNDEDDTETSDIDTPDNDPNDQDNPEEPDSDTDSGESGEVPECSKNSAMPCKAGGLIWSSRSAAHKEWADAKSDCEHWNEGSFTSGWRLPTISEFRKIIKNCSYTEPGGNCHVTDSCASFYDGMCYIAASCYYISEACPNYYEHSPFGETGKLWSGSDISDIPTNAWWVDFSFGAISFADKESSNGHDIYYRCVHSAN